jgi:hypothetical protein
MRAWICLVIPTVPRSASCELLSAMSVLRTCSAHVYYSSSGQPAAACLPACLLASLPACLSIPRRQPMIFSHLGQTWEAFWKIQGTGALAQGACHQGQNARNDTRNAAAGSAIAIGRQAKRLSNLIRPRGAGDDPLNKVYAWEENKLVRATGARRSPANRTAHLNQGGHVRPSNWASHMDRPDAWRRWWVATTTTSRRGGVLPFITHRQVTTFPHVYVEGLRSRHCTAATDNQGSGPVLIKSWMLLRPPQWSFRAWFTANSLVSADAQRAVFGARLE